MADFRSLTIGDTQKHFFYLENNGLNVLRDGSIFIANRFYDFYYDLTYKSETKLRIIMILGIVFLTVAIGVLIPIVFSVQKTNNKVLSLFGIIPMIEIKELSDKCEKYINNFLEEKNNKEEINDKPSSLEFFFFFIVEIVFALKNPQIKILKI